MIIKLTFLALFCAVLTRAEHPLLATLGSSTPHRKDPAKLALLYEKYPQLTANTTSSCVRAYSASLLNLTQYPYDQMSMLGTHGINDLGSYQ